MKPRWLRISHLFLKIPTQRVKFIKFQTTRKITLQFYKPRPEESSSLLSSEQHQKGKKVFNFHPS